MKSSSRPNILFIFTDQQNATMINCAGNAYLKTPAMDSLAETGVRFDRAYCTNPVCLPSRFSLMTGRMPSEINVRSNNAAHVTAIPDNIARTGLGWLFRQAGYDTAYGGKIHLPKMRPPDIGFDYITDDERDGLAQTCADYIKQPRSQPFLLVASFINPHDICYLSIRDLSPNNPLLKNAQVELATLDRALALPENVRVEDFFSRVCPPLPPNFEPQQSEPEAIRMILAQRPFKKRARDQWTEKQWRMHRWAYVRLTEMVDKQIGLVLHALRASGQEENTLVIFTSDHGDTDSAHRMEHKTTLYEEACRVPMIMSQPGVTPPGEVNHTHLVSNGLDLVPTLCDYAGIQIPNGLSGLSLRPLTEGRQPDSWRTSLHLESEFGRMIVTTRYKYMLYDQGADREQLIDLQSDPGEMRNASRDAENKAALLEHRKIFKDTFGS